MRLAVIAVLAGCDLAFGVDTVRPTPDAPPEQLVTGTFRQRYVANDASFAPIVGERIFPPGSISFAAILDDGTQPTVEYRADGTFTFPLDRVGQSYRLIYSHEGNRNEIQMSAMQPRLASLVAGRPDRTPVSYAVVQFPYPASNGVNQGAHIASTGVYTFSYTGQYGPTVMFDWRLATPAPAAVLGMLDASKHDRAYVLEYSADSTTLPGLPFTTLTGVSAASVTISPGSTTVLPQPTPAARNGCARFAAPNVAAHARLVAALPRAYAQSSGDWVMYLAPAPEIVGIAGAHYVAVCGYSPVRDLDIAPPFHDPFVGATLLVETAAMASFPVQLPGASPNSFPNITRMYAKVERGVATSCTSPRALIEAHVGIAGAFELAGTLLDSDGKVVAVDLTRDVPLAWSQVADGPIDLYTLALYELTNVNGATTANVRWFATVIGQATAIIDRTLLASGGKYIFAITTSLGRPNAATGDLETLALPFENSTSWSFYFEVQAR